MTIGTGDRLLVVREAGTVAAGGAPGPEICLSYRFEPGLTEARLLDRREEGDRLVVEYAVPVSCRVLRADFRQQVLNLPMVDLLARRRPLGVRVESLHGCTLDLPRLAALLRVPATVVLPPPADLPDPSGRAGQWVRDSLAAAHVLELPDAETPVASYAAYTSRIPAPSGAAPAFPRRVGPAGAFDYALYEFALRDHPLLWRMQEGYVRFFEGCRDVLDVGCGAGVFLGLLENAGIPARGVERNPAVAAYARGLGFDVTESDALAFLARNAGAFDGIYCSHFVEHLPVDAVERLLHLMAVALRPRGRLVLVFPDPESIRSQLLGFWRDPEHVRFYHPDLVELIGLAHGLDCVWHSHRDAVAHGLVSFPALPSIDALTVSRAQPEKGSAGDAGPNEYAGVWSRWITRLGLVPRSRLRELEQRLEHSERLLDRLGAELACLCDDTRRLWQVNQTWAWEDNAVLVLRKPSRSTGRVEEPSVERPGRSQSPWRVRRSGPL
jgi:SAM-dependent methyltransferase